MTWTLEEATRLAQFEAGETHLTEVNKDLTDQLVNKGYGLVKSTGPAQQVQINFTGLYFGTEDESRDKYIGTTGKLDPDLPFTDIRVRQAINKAIDRETLRLELYKGRVDYSYVHGFYLGLPGWDDTWPDRFDDLYGYDVDEAKRLMAEAGYENGFEASAWLFPFPGAPELIPVMEQVQIYLQEIGIDLTLTETDWAGTVIPALGSRDHPGVLWAIPPSKKVVETQIAGFNAGYNIISTSMRPTNCSTSGTSCATLRPWMSAISCSAKSATSSSSSSRASRCSRCSSRSSTTPTSSRPGSSPAGTAATSATLGWSTPARPLTPCN